MTLSKALSINNVTYCSLHYQIVRYQSNLQYRNMFPSREIHLLYTILAIYCTVLFCSNLKLRNELNGYIVNHHHIQLVYVSTSISICFPFPIFFQHTLFISKPVSYITIDTHYHSKIIFCYILYIKISYLIENNSCIII